MRVVRGDHKQDADIGKSFEALVVAKSQAFVGFHALTGCDQTGNFKDNAKQSCWNTFITSPKNVINFFILLGNSIEHPLKKCIEGLTLFILNLYSKCRPTHIDSLSKLQCYMLSKKQLESDKLPLIFSALKYMIYQSHYMTLICKVLGSYKYNFV